MNKSDMRTSSAADVQCPVFITSAKSEKENWQPIYNSISHDQKSFFLPEDEEKHGSKALWDNNPGHELYWKAVNRFLLELKPRIKF